MTISCGLRVTRWESWRFLLDEVLPGLTEDDIVHRGFAHSQGPRQLLLVKVRPKGEDRSYLLLGELGTVMVASSPDKLRLAVTPMGLPSLDSLWAKTARVAVTKSTTALSHHVSQVIGLGPNEEVRWPNAQPLIAVMAHEHPGWDQPKVQFPRKAVGDYHFSPVPESSPTVRSNLTRGSGPQPAAPKFWAVLWDGSLFVDLSPESCFEDR